MARDDELLFSESQSRFVVTVLPEREAEFEAIFQGRPAARVGRVTEEPLLVLQGLRGYEVVRSPLSALKGAWQAPLKDV